jgi:hypothetical protein
MAQSYVVVSFAAGETAAFKHFGLWEGAKAFSQDHLPACDRAEIWRVRADDATSAIAAAELGEGELLEVHAKRSSAA